MAEGLKLAEAEEPKLEDCTRIATPMHPTFANLPGFYPDEVAPLAVRRIPQKKSPRTCLRPEYHVFAFEHPHAQAKSRGGVRARRPKDQRDVGPIEYA
jgi:hypothetical protein